MLANDSVARRMFSESGSRMRELKTRYGDKKEESRGKGWRSRRKLRDIREVLPRTGTCLETR